MYCLIGVDSDVFVCETATGIESQIREGTAHILELEPIFVAPYTLEPAQAEMLTLGFLHFLRIGCALMVPQHVMNTLVCQISDLQWPKQGILESVGLN